MSQIVEFAGNHLMLFGALVVVTVLIIKMELENKFSGINQLGAVDTVRFMNDHDTLLLDVRESNEYATGHIKESLHIPMSTLKKRLGELDKYKNKQIVACCRSGSRSNYACKLLKKAGFENVTNMSGGIMGWSSANLPLTKK